ncbi:unnamed protein product [Caretta caretta]
MAASDPSLITYTACLQWRHETIQKPVLWKIHFNALAANCRLSGRKYLTMQRDRDEANYPRTEAPRIKAKAKECAGVKLTQSLLGSGRV